MRLRSALAVALVVITSAAPLDSVAAPVGRPGASDVELIGAFFVGIPISGAAQLDGYLYVTTGDRLSIYDVTTPAAPTLASTIVSPNPIYGELISTNGETLLLSNGFTSGTLDIYSVENKTNPVMTASLENVPDEHVSCLLECTWAYGSEGSIVDLRKPGAPVLRSENWKEIVGIPKHMHRLDEFLTGYMATAPRQGVPFILDARKPVKPRIIARIDTSDVDVIPYLYSLWARGGSDRFIIASTEGGQCNNGYQGALMTFDTKAWPKKTSFPLADTYKYSGRTNSEGCSAYYFSLHPDFEDGGLLVLPSGLDGIRLLDIGDRGQLNEVGTFTPPIADVWLAFWGDDEIIYALNRTGEVYILRYT